jgi:serine/threonine protein kinase
LFSPLLGQRSFSFFFFPLWSTMSRVEEMIKNTKDSEIPEPKAMSRHFSMEKHLAGGMYGQVFTYIHRKSGKRFAVKRVLVRNHRGHKCRNNSRETRLLMSLFHPHIITGLALYQEPHVLNDQNNHLPVFRWNVMEYCPGTLAKCLRNGALPKARARDLLRQLLEGVACLHSHWIMHRDLKPDNILLTDAGQLKICDFSLACPFSKEVPDEDSDLRDSNVVTLWYRAPELAFGVKYHESSIDMWSVACVFYEMATGSVLFHTGGVKDATNRHLVPLFIQSMGYPSTFTWPQWEMMVPERDRLWVSLFTGAGKYPLDQLLRSRFENLEREFLHAILIYNPLKRLTATEALEHALFKTTD